MISMNLNHQKQPCETFYCAEKLLEERFTYLHPRGRNTVKLSKRAKQMEKVNLGVDKRKKRQSISLLWNGNKKM